MNHVLEIYSLGWLLTNYLLIQIKRNISFLILKISRIQTVALILILILSRQLILQKTLVLFFQSDMSMDKHISAEVKSCFLQLRDFHRIRPLISKTAAIILANAFVHSHLDYCNSLFYGLPKYSIHRLQKIQNTTARIVTRISRFTHITPILKSLHWLPVSYRINFKICCLTHRAISLGETILLALLAV